MSAKILLIEDEGDISDLMMLHLKREGYQVTTAAEGESGWKLYQNGAFDLLIVDWMLPGISGLEICKRIAGKTPILMVTARADTVDTVLGLESGADDYITKPFEIPLFMARVRALLRRAKMAETASNQTADQLDLGSLKILVDQHKVLQGDEEVKLTKFEFKLLKTLVSSKGKVLSRSRLIDQVQGSDIAVTDRTIDTHIFGLRKKLGNAADLIETIRGVGYRVKL